MIGAVTKTQKEPKALTDKPKVESQEPNDNKASLYEPDDKIGHDIVSKTQLNAEEDESSE